MTEQHQRKVPVQPSLTEQQRLVGYQRSLLIRQRRAEIKAALKSGEKSLVNVWQLPAVEGMKVVDLLQALPGVGRRIAEAICLKAKIPHSTTVRGCGPRQKEALFLELSRLNKNTA